MKSLSLSVAALAYTASAAVTSDGVADLGYVSYQAMDDTALG